MTSPLPSPVPAQVPHDLQEGTRPFTSASFLFSPELRLCWRLPGMRILPVLYALLLLMLRGVTGKKCGGFVLCLCFFFREDLSPEPMSDV